MSSNILLWIVVAVAAYLLYTWIDRRRWAGRIKITGSVMLNGGHDVEVESDPAQQRVLARVAGHGGTDNEDLVVTLVAVPTDAEPAIVVRIGRDVVGRFPASAEKRYMPVMRRLLSHNKLGECRATIVPLPTGSGSGAPVEDAEPRFVLRLDLATPDKAIPAGTFTAEGVAS